MTKHVDVASLRTTVTAPTVISADYERIELLQAFADAIGNPGEVDGGPLSQAMAEQTALIERIMLAPARDQADAAAKVRMLLEHVMPASWRGADENLDWDIAMARRLLLSLAGLDSMIDPVG